MASSKIPFVHKFTLFLSTKRQMHGIQIAVFALQEDEDIELCFETVDDALDLIKRFAPLRYKQIQTHIKIILVLGDSSANGTYVDSLKMISLYDEFVKDEDQPIERVAQVIVHEAQHEKLRRHGFGYTEDIRNRIELICKNAERGFLKRLPDDQECLIDMTNDTIEWLKTADLSAREYWKRKLKVAEDLDFPKWLIALLRWNINRKLTKFEQKNPPPVIAPKPAKNPNHKFEYEFFFAPWKVNKVSLNYKATNPIRKSNVDLSNILIDIGSAE